MKTTLQIVVILMVAMLPMGVMGQNAIIGTGFAIGWNGGDEGDWVFFDSGAGSSRILIRSANGTGNQYFRLVRGWASGGYRSTQFRPASGSDTELSIFGQEITPLTGDNNGAYFINVTSTDHSYVFKTRTGDGADADSRFLVLEVEGDVRTISSLNRDLTDVFAGQSVVVTAEISSAFNVGQGVYLRYTTDNYTSSAVIAMSGSGTTYTATIPTSANSTGTTVQYYAFTSGSDLTISGTDADFYSINLSSSSDYTVQSWATAQAGDWSTAATWSANAVPSTTANLGSVTIGHDVTLDQEAFVSSITINNGATFTASDASERILHVVKSSSGTTQTFTNNGTWANGTGGSVVRFTGAPSSGDAIHTVGGSGTTAFQEVRISKTSGSSNVGAGFSTGTSVVDALRISSGGFVSSAPPSNFYGANATLEFNTGANYDVNPGDNTWSTTEVPSSIRILSGTVTVIQARSFSGSLTIESGATLVTNGNVTGQSGSNLVNNGTVTGDLTFQRTISNSVGWRMMSSPINTSYSDVLAEVWTQGATVGADVTNGTSNVRTYNGTSFVDVTDLSTNVTAGQGFIYFHFNDDNYDGTPNSGATVLSVTGTEQSGATVNVPANGWALAGNPFASSLDWDSVTKNSVSGTVYVYDANYTSLGSSPDVAESGSTTGNYRAWNGSAGSLTDGLIAPFQGFWVDSEGEVSSIVIEADDKATSGVFRGKERPSNILSLAVKGQGMQSESFLEFSYSGELTKDSKDAFKLRPLSDDFALLYTQLADGTTLDINHLPVPQDELRIPLGVDVTRSGEFELFLSSSNLPDEWMISVVDEVTGTESRLDRNTRYRFTESRMAKRGNAISPDGPMKVAASSPRFTLIIDPHGVTLSTKDDGRGTMDVFALDQNYPNPFNPSTQIRFTLQSSDVTRLTVYDILGREIAVLVDGVMPAGAHTATFDASNLTSGVYIYKLEAGGQVMTKRMTLVK